MLASEALRIALFGNPPSATYQPSREGTLEAFTMLEDSVAILSFGGVGVIKDTRAHLNADLAHAAYTLALVYADATDANNDFYVKVGGSGSGSWTLTTVLHDSLENLAQPYVDAMQAIADSLATFARQYVGEPSVATTASTWGALWTVDPTVSLVDGYFSKANIAVAVAQTVRFMVVTLEGDGTLTLGSSVLRSVVAGVNEDVNVGLPISVGQYIGYQCSVAPYFTNGVGKAYWYIAANAPITSHTTKIISTPVAVEFGGHIVGSDAYNVDYAADLHETIGDKFDEQQIGDASVSVTADDWVDGLSLTLPTTTNISGYITSFNVALSAPATVQICAITNNGDGTLTKTSSQAFNLGTGANNAVPCMVPIAAGQYVGIYSTKAIHYANPGAAAVWYSVGQIGTATSYTVSSPVTLEFGALVQGDYAAKLVGTDDVGSLSPLFGFKCAAVGTSITAQGFYTNPLASLTGMELTNLGVGGGAIGLSTNGHYGSLAIYNAMDSIPLDTQIVLIEAGINDFAVAAVPIGAYGDTTTATFYGALHAGMVKLRDGAGGFAGVPDAKPVFMVPHGGDSRIPGYMTTAVNGLGLRLRQFWTAIDEVAAMWGVPIINVGREAGIGLWSQDDKSDGYHINTAGGVTHADYDNRRLLEIYDSGYFD